MASVFDLLLILLFAQVSLGASLKPPNVISVVRHHVGDYYVVKDFGAGCRCLPGGALPQSVASYDDQDTCQCGCPPHTPVLRDDTFSCVSELTDLKSPGGVQLVSPVCVVTRAEKLTGKGWQSLPNTTLFEPPFRLYRNNGQSFLRWVGDSAVRFEVEGHLVLVSLRCRDTASPTAPHFAPCVAFRAAGSVLLKPEGRTAEPSVGQKSSSARGWLIGGAVAAVAVVAYLTVVACFIYRRKTIPHLLRKERNIQRASTVIRASKRKSFRGQSTLERRESVRMKADKPSLVSETEIGSIEEVEDLSGLHSSRSLGKSSPVASSSSVGQNVAGEDTINYTNYGFGVMELDSLENSGFAGEGNSSSHQTNPASNYGIREINSEDGIPEPFYLSSGNSPVSRAQNIANTEEFRDHLEQPDMNGTNRKKLYFNPSYFEPELLQEPPPAALDFLDKIRDIISSAKLKMRNRTFQPSLNDIPEDDYTYYSQSRPQSRVTIPATPGRRSRFSFRSSSSDKGDVEDLTNQQSSFQYENVVSQDPQQGANHDDSFALDSLDGGSEAESRASTLKRIAKRVNERGTSFVSEIIRTLDRKNKNFDYSPNNNMKNKEHDGSHIKVSQLVKVHSYDQSSQSSNSKPRFSLGDNHPDIIKPSVFRSALKDTKSKRESGSTFENFCQEMIATFSRIKRHNEPKTPSSTLGKKKNVIQPDETTNTQAQPVTENGDRKVRKWLEGLSKEGVYPNKLQESDIGSYLQVEIEEVHSKRVASHQNQKAKVSPNKNGVTDMGISQNSDMFNASLINEGKIDKSNISKSQLSFINHHDNTYEEITLANKDKRQDNNLSCSDDDSLVSDTSTVKEIKYDHGRRQNNQVNTGTLSRKLWHDEEDLDTTFEQDTLERQPVKRRSTRPKNAVTEQQSDYCNSESDDVYAPEGSIHSLATFESENYSRFKMKDTQKDYLQEDYKPPLPPKQCSSPDSNSSVPPVRPPKSSKSSPIVPDEKPPLPEKGGKNEKKFAPFIPPSLPAKQRQNSKNSNKREMSEVPELSDEAAEAILHGLQAHKSPLQLRSTVSFRNKSRPKGLERNTHSTKSLRDFKGKIMSKTNFGRSETTASTSQVSPLSNSSEEMIRGQFILAPEGKSPSSRKNSLSRSGRGSSSRSTSSNTEQNVKLCQCARSELEKHFVEKDKLNADTIKNTWRKVVGKSDSQSDKEVTTKSSAPYVNEETEPSRRCKKCTKQKQEDSGYQSSDSNESEQSNDNSLYESSCSIDLESSDELSQKISDSSNFGPQIFPKSHSLHHLKDDSVPNVYRGFHDADHSGNTSPNKATPTNHISEFRHDLDYDDIVSVHR